MSLYRSGFGETTASSSLFNIIISTLIAGSVALSLYAISGQSANLLSVYDENENFLSGIGPQGQFILPQYSNADWPDPLSNEGAVIYLTTDDIPIYSDGTNWKDFAGNIKLPPTDWVDEIGYNWDGVSNEGAHQQPFDFGGATQVSIALTVKGDWTSLRAETLWCIADAGFTYQFELQRQSNGTLRVFANGARKQPAITGVNGINHVVVVYDGTQAVAADRIKIYYNGVEVTATPVGTLPTSLNAGLTIEGFYIGKRRNNANDALGVFSELSIWDKPLSAAEVTSLYNSGSRSDPSLISGLVSSYWFGDNPLDTNLSVRDNEGIVNLTVDNTDVGDIISL